MFWWVFFNKKASIRMCCVSRLGVRSCAEGSGGRSRVGVVDVGAEVDDEPGAHAVVDFEVAEVGVVFAISRDDLEGFLALPRFTVVTLGVVADHPLGDVAVHPCLWQRYDVECPVVVDLNVLVLVAREQHDDRGALSGFLNRCRLIADGVGGAGGHDDEGKKKLVHQFSPFVGDFGFREGESCFRR